MKAEKTLVGKIHSAVLDFTVGEDPVLDLELAEVDCIGTAAHVTMLSRLSAKHRVFTAAERKRIVAALVSLVRKIRQGKFEITFQDQDVHLAVERMLTARLGDLGKRVHTARSRNDQVAVDLRLFAKEALLSIQQSSLLLAGALLGFAREHEDVPMVGRTHMQPAMPSSVGLWASAYAEGLLDDLVVLQAAYDVNNRSPLGSAAGYGVSLDIDRELTAKLLGFPAPIHNVLCAVNARGKCESIVLAALGQLMMTLSRISQDLILYSMPEFGYFKLPGEFCTGSSIMPQKQNPDVLELIRSRAVRVLGDANAVAGMVCGLPGGYNRDLQEAKGPFINGLWSTFASLEILSLMVDGIEVNDEALAAGFTPEVFAADKALALVAEGMPFRDAYQKVKAQLDDLAAWDPDEALANKKHLGAPGGLDLDMLSTRVRECRGLVIHEKRRYDSSISKLLGLPYPGLKKAKTKEKK